MTKTTKTIAGQPKTLTVNDLICAGAEGDAAAINILDMIDLREIKRDAAGNFDEALFATLYNATQE